MKKTDGLPTTQLIVQLAAGARAVAPLPPPPLRLARWMVVTAVLAGVAVFWIGPRQDFPAAMLTLPFAASLVLLAVAAIGGGAAAFSSSVPGADRSSLERMIPFGAGVAWPLVWILLLAQPAVPGAPRPTVFHSACIIEILGVALLSGALLIVMIRRAAPLRPAWTAATASLAAIAAGSATAQVICPLSDPAHQLFGHALVAAILGLCLLLAGHRALYRSQNRHERERAEKLTIST